MSKPLNFESLVSAIEQTHLHFQQQAVKAVNVSLTIRNWLIGYFIVEFELIGEDRSKYGDNLFTELAKKFKHIKGVDRRSLYRFKDFYLLYPQIATYIVSDKNTFFLPNAFPTSIVGSVTPLLDGNLKVPVEKILYNLSYTHIEQLLTIEDPLKRSFYEIATIKGTWSVKELKRQINSLYLERMGMSQKPELLSELTQKEIVPQTPNQIVKSVYVFEFLGLNPKDAVEEEDLETALLDHLRDFNHHNIGQLNTYVNYYKAEVMQPDDNPTVGILLVTQKNNALVEYTTAGMDNQLFVSKYL